MSWVSVDPEAAHEHAEYTGLVILGVMTSSTLKKDHPSTFFECQLIASSRVSIKCHLEAWDRKAGVLAQVLGGVSTGSKHRC